jgi:AraC family transcriptional regulator
VTRPLGGWALRRFNGESAPEYRSPGEALTSSWYFLVLFLDGRRGTIAIYDRDLAWLENVASSKDYLLFRFPRSAFRDLPNRSGNTPTGQLSCSPAERIVDPVVLALGESLLGALDGSARLGHPFVEHVLRALMIHLAQRFGESGAARASERSEAAPRWLQRAKALLSARSDSSPTIAEVASEFELSVGQFSRTFRKHTGVPPHRWQLQRRIEHAKHLLKDARPLTEVAIACGFADQSHFTRTFRAMTGSTPRRFRDALSPNFARRPHRTRDARDPS